MSDNSIVIELVTTEYIYGAADEITLRTSQDGWEENDIEAKEINDCIWKFELSNAKYLNGFEFKFVLNRRFWSSGNNFIISGKEATQHHEKHRPYQYYLNNFGFELPTPTHNVFRIDYIHVNEEYRALRAEIQRRSQDQQNIVNISLVSFGALLAAGSRILDSSDPSKWSELYNSLFLIGPWLFLNLGILWCDHDKFIHKIGMYIRDVLENRCFPSTTPNLNFPAIVNKNINPYKESFTTQTTSDESELDKSQQINFYNELRSVNLGWQKVDLLLNNSLQKKNPNLILPNIFPLIYFLLPSLLLILVYIIDNILPVVKAIDIELLRVFYNTYFSNWSGFIDLLEFLLGYLFSRSFWLKWVPFLVDLYLLKLFWTNWRQCKQERTKILFWE